MLLKVHLTDLAARRSAEPAAEESRMLYFEPYGATRRQLLNLLRDVNRTRKRAGLNRGIAAGPVPAQQRGFTDSS